MSCQYRCDGNKCKKLNDACIAMYWCNKIMGWKEISRAKEVCKYMSDEMIDVPKGYTKVEFVRHNKLYINIDGVVRPYDNPFDDIPQYVKVKKTKNGYKFEK